MWGKRKFNHEEEAPAARDASPSPQVASANEKLLGTQSAADLGAMPKSNGAEPGATNGVEGTGTPAGANRAGPTAGEIRFAVTFTRIVSILTRSPHYKRYTLSDLEWLVVPAILTGQSAVMEAKINDRQVPVAVALWASVSEEVDKRLSGDLAVPIKLRPNEWRSGAILWLIDAVGDPRAVPLLLKQVRETTFKGRDVKMRALGALGAGVLPAAQP